MALRHWSPLAEASENTTRYSSRSERPEPSFPIRGSSPEAEDAIHHLDSPSSRRRTAFWVRSARVADGIEAAAVEGFVSAAVAELAEEQLLRDLADLRAVFASPPGGSLPEAIEPFRLLPEAVLRWLQSRFGLTPYLEAGKVMQVPSERLDGFTIAGDRGPSPAGVLVRVRILAPGWKRGPEVAVPPRAELVG